MKPVCKKWAAAMMVAMGAMAVGACTGHGVAGSAVMLGMMLVGEVVSPKPSSPYVSLAGEEA